MSQIEKGKSMKTFIRPEIEINDPCYEWTGEIRKARGGECICGLNGRVQKIADDIDTTLVEYFILRKRFVVPDFVPPGWWLAIDENGDVWIYLEKPWWDEGRWNSAGGQMNFVKTFLAAHNINLPDVRGEKAIWQREVSNG